MKQHKWTDIEYDVVRSLYIQNIESKQRIANILDLTVGQVHGAVARLGLCKRTGRKSWDPKQDDQLRRLINRHTTARIATIMKRSENSVVVRSKRLKLHRRYRDGWYTKLETCEILGVDHKRVQGFIDSGKLRASWHNGHKPQKNGMAMWHIDEKDLAAFIKRYPQELNGRNVDIIQIVDILVGLDYVND